MLETKSVADFIEDRVATRIGAKHHMILFTTSPRILSRYAEYMKQLLAKAGLRVLDRSIFFPF